MVAPTTIGLNFTSINDYNLTFSLPSQASEVMPAMISAANSGSSGLFTIISMSAIWFILFWITNDKTPFGEFKYSDAKAAGASLGMVSVLGISFLETGFYTNYKAVLMFGILFVLLYVFITAYEDKQ